MKTRLRLPVFAALMAGGLGFLLGTLHERGIKINRCAGHGLRTADLESNT